MKGKGFTFDIFAATTLLAIGVSVYIFVDTFVNRSFTVFITEDEIGEAIEAEFPLFAEYLL